MFNCKACHLVKRINFLFRKRSPHEPAWKSPLHLEYLIGIVCVPLWYSDEIKDLAMIQLS